LLVWGVAIAKIRVKCANRRIICAFGGPFWGGGVPTTPQTSPQQPPKSIITHTFQKILPGCPGAQQLSLKVTRRLSRVSQGLQKQFTYDFYHALETAIFTIREFKAIFSVQNSQFTNDPTLPNTICSVGHWQAVSSRSAHVSPARNLSL